MNTSHYLSIFRSIIVLSFITLFVGCGGGGGGSKSDPVPEESALDVSITSPEEDITITEGEAVNFLGAVVGGTPPYNYEWNFGGYVQNSFIENPGSITFDKVGIYNVTFTVHDARGNIISATRIITVETSNLPTWYRDADGDGYGDPDISTHAQTQPSGYVSNDADRDDNNPAVNPDAPEVCSDGVDNDCDGWIDEGCTGYSIKGVIHHRGVPMNQLTTVKPSIWCRDEDSGGIFDSAAITYNSNEGTYEILNLTGSVGVFISYNLTGGSRSLPGNYDFFRVVNEGDAGICDIEMCKIMHLLEPWDNMNTIINGDPLVEYLSPLKFAWDGVAGATRYEVIIWKRTPTSCYSIEYVSMQSTVYTTTLEKSATDECYEFEVTAYNGTDVIGYIMTTFSTGWGWDYDFKIK